MSGPRSGDAAPSRVTGRRARRFLRSLLALFIAAILLAVPLRASAQVLVVLSDESAGYQAVADELRTGLAPVRDRHIRIDTTTASRLASIDAPAFNAYELVVTVGLAAAQGVMLRETDVVAPPLTLCLLIPRQTYEHLAPPRGNGHERRLSAVFIDQPLSRQLDLLRIALPDKHRVGAILGPTSRGLEDELREQAKAHALTLRVAEVSESTGVYAALQTVMPESDVFLLLPDPVVSNADTVYGLLLTSYRAQVPVAGFSEGLVNAGSLLSLFSSARQQGRQGAEIASRILGRNGGLSAPQYPRYFTVRVNASVARSLGLHMASETVLTDALGETEDSTTPGSPP
jgi:putative tryptophan/tyrosine transport system substrate-binding protein